MNHEQWMQAAIDIARQGMRAGQTPFGAVIVHGGEIVSAEHNAVWARNDPTAHAEIRAIRAAGAALGRVDLAGCAIYSTCEPCPMCFSAIHWANLDCVYYGADIADAQRAGFREMPISNEQMKTLGHSDVDIVSDLLGEQCRALFEEWMRREDRRTY